MTLLHNHSPGLMLLSLVIAVLGAYASLIIVSRSHRRGRSRSAWLALAALIFGTGVWTMHFTAMLAYELPFEVSYEPRLTLASLLLAWLFTALGLQCAEWWRHPLRLPVAGSLMGLGIAGMHYIGMAALQMPARLQFSPVSVLAACMIGVVACWLALAVVHHAQLQRHIERHRWLAALCGGLAVSGLHYVAMLGTSVHVEAAQWAPVGFSDTILAGGVTLVAAVLLTGAVLLAKMDETQERQEVLQASLEQARLRQQMLTGSRQMAELEVDHEGRLLFISDAARQLLQLGEETSPSLVLDLIDPAQRLSVQERWRQQADPGEFVGDLAFRIGDRTQVLHVRAATLQGSDGDAAPRWLVLLQMPEALQDGMTQDPESGLPNRLAVLALNTEQPVLAIRVGLPVLEALAALLSPELYRRLLVNLVQMVQSVVSREDLLLLSRPAGAELLLLVRRGHQDEDALLQRLRRVLSLPVRLEGQSWHVGAQFGVATLEAGVAGEEILRTTAAALRRAQREQLEIHVYDAAFDTQWRQQILIEQELRTALAENQFFLLFQPKWDVQRKRVCGFEALLRWRRPGRRQPEPPDRFIPVLEATGLIQPVGRWVIEEGLRTLADVLSGPDFEHLTLAVNVSPVQLRSENFQRHLEDCCARHGILPGRLELEITEGIAMDRSRDNLDTLRALRTAGFHLAIDDFGTGYSSLAYLRDFPMHSLKIDRAFVDSVDRDRTAADLVRLMVDIGHTLHYQLVAEGVETVAQLDVLSRLGVDQIQGFWLAPPLPAEELPAFVTVGAPQRKQG